MITKSKTPAKPKAAKVVKTIAPDSTAGTQYTAFRCPKSLLALVKTAAEKDNRSVSSYIVIQLTKAVGA